MSKELFADATTEEALIAGLTALGLLKDGSEAIGVSFVAWPPGSLNDRLPNGNAPQANTTWWGNILCNWSDDDWQALVDQIIATSVIEQKESQNGRAGSEWYAWRQAQMPSLGATDEFRLFKESAEGEPVPVNRRMVWAV